MYKIKYYLWLVAIAVCFHTNVHAVPDSESNSPCNPPTNDTQLFAIDLTNETICYNGTNLCATEETTYTNSCEYNTASVWYKFQVSNPGYHEIRITNTTFNSALTLFKNDLSEITCVNDDKFSFGEHLCLYLESGWYYIMVTGTEDGICVTEGEFCIAINTIDPPDNQDCLDNLPVINLSTTSETPICTGSNKYASNANPQPSCSYHTGASVWYKIKTPSGSDPVPIMITSAVRYSEVITVYEGSCNSLTEKVCWMNDGSADDFIVSLIADTEYYIQVTGNFETIETYNQDCSEGEITISTNVTCPSSGECDDYNPDTIDDQWLTDCTCQGTCLYEDDTCDDGNPDTGDSLTGLDAYDENCNCVGDCQIPVNTPCDDGRPETINDTIDTSCNCTSECILGTPCNDGNPDTENDIHVADCECIGTIPGEGCEENLIVDANNVSQGLFEASNSIETSGAVTVNQSLELNAGSLILLHPGFIASEGTYFHAYIDGCEPDDGQKVDESAIASVKHYPNPFKDEFTLEFNLTTDAEAQIIISDVNGRTITQLPAKQLYLGTQTVNISTENWITGIYFYRVQIREQDTHILSYANGTLVKI